VSRPFASICRPAPIGCLRRSLGGSPPRIGRSARRGRMREVELGTPTTGGTPEGFKATDGRSYLPHSYFSSTKHTRGAGTCGAPRVGSATSGLGSDGRSNDRVCQSSRLETRTGPTTNQRPRRPSVAGRRLQLRGVASLPERLLPLSPVGQQSIFIDVVRARRPRVPLRAHNSKVERLASTWNEL
jgi:hypothetical protein